MFVHIVWLLNVLHSDSMLYTHTHPPLQPASSCNETRYPVVDYTISITGLDGSIDVPHTGQDIVASLTSGVFPGLQEDTYSVLVMACADFACQPADPVTVGQSSHLPPLAPRLTHFPPSLPL